MRQPIICRSPEIMGGAPVFCGTRVPVQTLLDYLEAGDSMDEFLEGFPSVSLEQVIAFLEDEKDRRIPKRGDFIGRQFQVRRTEKRSAFRHCGISGMPKCPKPANGDQKIWRNALRFSTLRLVLALSALLPCTSTEAAQTELLSIQGLPINKNQYINRFKIDTWGVEVLAVCHLPSGWLITGGTYGSPAGVLSGESSRFVANLWQSQLPELESLFLINVREYQELSIYIPNRNSFYRRIPNSEYHPATFAGSVHVGRYGQDSEGRKTRLVPSNFVRVPAARCPDPPTPAE